MWCGQVVKEVMTMTKDRDKWRTFVASPMRSLLTTELQEEEEEEKDS